MSDYEAIRSDMMNQLRAKGCDSEYYVSVVNEYMQYKAMLDALNNDIKERGVVIASEGVTAFKRNDSIGESVKVKTIMLKLADSIGIKPNENAVVGDDDEL